MDDSPYRVAPYAARNRRVNRAGFETYATFLASPAWQAVRAKVLTHFKFLCWRCGGQATQVHHARYNPGSLSGTNVAAMVPLCRPCHQFGEFDGGRKCSLDEANARLGLTLDRVCPKCGKACRWYSFLFADSVICRCCFKKQARRRARRKG